MEGVVYAVVTLLEWDVNWHVIISNLRLEILGLYLVVADFCNTLLDVAFPIHLDSL